MKAALSVFFAWGGVLASAESGAAQDTLPPVLQGTWVQDDVGPVATYRRTYHFRADGSYEFVFTVRPAGASDQDTVAREEGSFSVRGGQLVIAPRSGPARAFPWRLDRDPYVGDVRLVLVRPDGAVDVFLRP